jgi:F-actin monooxygenase
MISLVIVLKILKKSFHRGTRLLRIKSQKIYSVQLERLRVMIEMSKKITDVGKSREKVPKWSREQFLARQNKMAQPDVQDSSERKFEQIDNTIKALDKQLKEGSVLDRGERGKNKVASLAGTFAKKKEDENSQVAQKAGLILTTQGLSENCHFCKQKVYLMEKITAEGLTLHRSCLKCHHCHTSLRLGKFSSCLIDFDIKIMLLLYVLTHI